MFKKYQTKLKKHFQEVLAIKKSPKEIALGFAIGTAITLLPIMILEPLIIAFIILIFKKVSKISLLLALIVWNPLVMLMIIPLDYFIGNLFLGDIPIINLHFEFLNQIFRGTLRYLIGSIVTSIVFSFISYF